MREKRQSRWRKLDNAAQAFPAATGKKDTRVFRFYCTLKEDIQEENLQRAVLVLHGAEKYPGQSASGKPSPMQQDLCAGSEEAAF